MDLCCACMKRSQVLISIFAPMEKSQEQADAKHTVCMADILNELVGWHLVFKENNALPQQMCQNCMNGAQASIEFKRMIETNSLNYIQMWSQRQDIVIKKELNDICDMLDMEDLEPAVNHNKPMETSEKKADVTNTTQSIQTRRNVYTRNNSNRTGEVKNINEIDIKRSIKQKTEKKISISHMADANLICPFCQWKSSTKGNLIVHIRTHTGERPYRCPYCTRAFTQRNGLNVHIRGHTGERPIRCPSCPLRFTQRAGLAAHFKRRHFHSEIKSKNASKYRIQKTNTRVNK